MITTTTFEANGRSFTKSVSDSFLIRKVGTDEVYSEAVDLLGSGFEYEETDLPLDDEEASYEELEAAVIELGELK